MLSSGGINGVQVALIDHSELQHLLSTQGKWDGISTLNNFLFEEENVTVCKAFEVGSGKTILWSKLPGNLVIECDKWCSAISVIKRKFSPNQGFQTGYHKNSLDTHRSYLPPREKLCPRYWITCLGIIIPCARRWCQDTGLRTEIENTTRSNSQSEHTIFRIPRKKV